MCDAGQPVLPSLSPAYKRPAARLSPTAPPQPQPQHCITMPDEGHYLDEYLSEILPKLGLDAETYGPYVTGFANDDDDTDEGMDDLIELLRASSESHGDDDALWQDFRNEILRRRKEFLDGEDTRKVSCFIVHNI